MYIFRGVAHTMLHGWKWPHPFSVSLGDRGWNKISGAQLGHRPIIMQKELTFYHVKLQRSCAYNITWLKMTTPFFHVPGGQGLKQNTRCTTRPQTYYNTKRNNFLSFTVSEELCTQYYMAENDHTLFPCPWGSYDLGTRWCETFGSWATTY